MRLPINSLEVTRSYPRSTVFPLRNADLSCVGTAVPWCGSLRAVVFLIMFGCASTLCEVLPVHVSLGRAPLAFGDIVGAARHVGSSTVRAREVRKNRRTAEKSTSGDRKQRNELSPVTAPVNHSPVAQSIESGPRPQNESATVNAPAEQPPVAQSVESGPRPQNESATVNVPVDQPPVTQPIESEVRHGTESPLPVAPVAPPLNEVRDSQAILERLKQPFAIPAEPFNDQQGSRIQAESASHLSRVPPAPDATDRLFTASVEPLDGEAESLRNRPAAREEHGRPLSHPTSDPMRSLPEAKKVAVRTSAQEVETIPSETDDQGFGDEEVFSRPIASLGSRCPICAGKDGQSVEGRGPYQAVSPWPEDEYICDGGDGNLKARVKADWSVQGLEMEDTIAHYDTLDGRTLVEKTCRNCIYAPRFAAVRKIEGVVEHQQREQMKQVGDRQSAEVSDKSELASSLLEQKQPVQQIGRKPVNIFRDRQDIGSLGQTRLVGILDDRFLPYENLKAIRYGVYDQAEKARLAEYTDAAQSWSHDAAVQVILDEVVAYVDVTQQPPQVLYKFDPQGKPKMCVVKTASCKSARPGDFIDFTLRFDNIGNERIGNVTLLDNLTPRLEYVPETAQSSLDADFFAEQNEGGSLILRWEIKAPVEAGQSGIIRFRCRVR